MKFKVGDNVFYDHEVREILEIDDSHMDTRYLLPYSVGKIWVSEEAVTAIPETVCEAYGNKHQHVLPVAWGYESQHFEYENGIYFKITDKFVTRLRCACGDEVSR